MTKSAQPRIAIVGAGLTGLTTAYYLKKAGIDFQVFEKDNRPGGVINTTRKDGFIFESGPNTGVLSHPEAAELLEELKGVCELEIADSAAKARWIWRKGKWEPLPSGLLSGITTPLFSFPDKLRLLGEPFRKKGGNPQETLAELVMRRMGKSFLNYAVDPFILGIYSGDPAKLVTKYALPKLYNLEQEYGSFIGGTVKKAKVPKTEREKKATREVFSVKGGLGNMVDALVKNIGEENITLNAGNILFSLTKDKRYELKGTANTFSHVISTIGSYELEKLFPFADSSRIKRINQLEYAKVVQVALGFKKWTGKKLNAFGGLVPFREKRDVLGILFLSSFLANRAPKEGAILSVFLGGVRKPDMVDLSDKQIIGLVEKEVKEMMDLKEFDPDLIKINRYKHAIPQYSFESEDKLNAISELEKEFPGLILAGNIRDGIGMSDRIKQGKIIAEQLIN